MRKRSGGFSLLEALITLTLMSVLLGVVASLMRDASTLMRQANADPVALLQSALEPVASDLRCAYRVRQCDSSGVKIVRLDPWDSARVPYPLPSSPSDFSLHDSDASWTVSYRVQQDSLWCDTVYPDSSSETIEVATGISALDGRFLEPGLVRLSVSTQDTSSNPVKVISLHSDVLLHLPVRVMP